MQARGISIATRCETVDAFVARFSAWTTENSIFVPVAQVRAALNECGFAILLSSRKPVLAGICIELDTFPDSNNDYGLPGLLLGIKRLGADSQEVFAQLNAARVARATRMPRATPPIVGPNRTMTESVVDDAAPTHVGRTTGAEGSTRTEMLETRTPGSPFILPANPLMNISDESLEGFVDCRLFEETDGFADGSPQLDPPEDTVAEPADPVLVAAPRRRFDSNAD